MRSGGGSLGWAFTRSLWLVALGAAALMAAELLPDRRAETASERKARDPSAGSRAPARGVSPPAGDRAVVLRADRSGHFWADGSIDGKSVRFMVDTGATGVALGRATAARVGLRTRERDFTVRSHTANGIARAAPVEIRRLQIGPITLYNVDARVMEQPMPGMALLGMSVLSRLQGYEVRGDRMVLYW